MSKKQKIDAHVEDDHGYCDWDGEVWPCKAWKKHVKSPGYRLNILEAEVNSLRGRIRSIESADATVRQDLFQLRALVQTLLVAHGDSELPHITIERSTEYDEMSFAHSAVIHRIPTLDLFEVHYTDTKGNEYVNGKCTTWRKS